MNRRHLTRTTLALVAALALTACGGDGADVTAPETPTSTSPAAPASDAPATGTPTDTPTETEPADDAPSEAALEVSPEGQELVLTDATGARVLHTLPDEGESVFRAAAVRPGSTPTDLTVVVVTSAEGMYDLRWLDVVDGQTGELRTFPERYALDPAVVTAEDAVPTPVWSPDGRSLAWALPVEDGATLQTIGWSDGPGTGDTADDNAAFALEGVPADAQARAWTAAADGTTRVALESADGRAFDAVLERQADGALALLRVDVAD